MEDEVKKIIVEDLDINIRLEDFDGNTPLFDGGISMDSIVFTEFLLLLEKKFKIEFDDDDLNIENFDNVKKISGNILKKTAS